MFSRRCVLFENAVTRSKCLGLLGSNIAHVSVKAMQNPYLLGVWTFSERERHLRCRDTVKPAYCRHQRCAGALGNSNYEHNFLFQRLSVQQILLCGTDLPYASGPLLELV